VGKLKSPFVITLKEDISKLDEVQVMAYGQTTEIKYRRSNTVTAKEIQNYPVGNALTVLQERFGYVITKVPDSQEALIRWLSGAEWSHYQF